MIEKNYETTVSCLLTEMQSAIHKIVDACGRLQDAIGNKEQTPDARYLGEQSVKVAKWVDQLNVKAEVLATLQEMWRMHEAEAGKEAVNGAKPESA